MPQTPPTQQEYWNSKVGEEWARQADRTDATFAPITQAAFATLALQPGERVLDIGCGAGETTVRAAQSVGVGGRAVGVDISRPLLDLARARAEAPNVDFVEADAGASSIPGAPFDAAFSRFGTMFFEAPAAAFARIRENLRPGGRIVFITWRTFAENVWSATPVHVLTPMLKTPLQPADPDAPGPFALQDAGKIKIILDASCWRDVSVTPWDGDVVIGGGGGAQGAADFLLRIGPCARAIADQGLDRNAAETSLIQALAPHADAEGVKLAAACWIVRATA